MPQQEDYNQLQDLISTDQSGYIKTDIGFNIRLIEDIIDYSENLEIDSAILFLDFKKAFDMVEWPFMFSTLKYMGFWDSFLKCFSTFYTNITCKYYNI